MNATRRITLLILFLLVAGAVAGLVATRDRAAPEARPGAAPSAPGGATAQASRSGGKPGAAPRRRLWLVDMRPLLTARHLSALAATAEEQELSRHAERLADHATDLAFTVAVRDATETATDQSPEVRTLSAARAKAQGVVDGAQARVKELEAKVAAAPETGREALQEQLEVARAELELDRDELGSASDALQRAGGDPQAHIRRLREVYDAAQKEPRPPTAAPPAAGAASSLLDRLRAWSWHRDVRAQLSEAKRDVDERAQRISKRREELTAAMQRDASARDEARALAARFASGTDPRARASKDEALKTLTRYAEDERRLGAVGRRLQDLRDLGETYGTWISVVEGHARGALHRLLWGVLALLGLVALGFAVGEVLDRAFRRVTREKLRVETLRTVGRAAVNIVTLLLALFFIFGLPSQATTVLGLAGAGLTVAMKDFIVAFFGWFILMGRNGIRVGDWVEIKGVGGEVVEIGLFHTVLLETGSWNDAGHPTGRRVSFVNSFAIEGHYFNFSTSGQWMWDELRLLIPLGRDPYPVIDGVQKLVETETEANAKLAETEWRKTTSRYRVQTFSAVPGIHVVPTGSGIEVLVRYITRAHERHESRRRLYGAVVELMHGKRGDAPAAGASVA